MRGTRIPLVALLLVELLILFFALEHHISHERWDVKTFADPSRGLVRLDRVVDTSVAALRRTGRPARPPAPGERSAPVETTVYRVRAKLLAVHRQLDLDLHLEVADPADPSQTMIVEIPAPEDAKGSGLEEALARARNAVERATRGARPSGGWDVVVTGIGFFDFTHFQPGAAPEGIELHPVLKIEFPRGG